MGVETSSLGQAHRAPSNAKISPRKTKKVSVIPNQIRLCIGMGNEAGRLLLHQARETIQTLQMKKLKAVQVKYMLDALPRWLLMKTSHT
jgi:hypothetical protein